MCNDFGRTMHVGGFGGRNAPIPGGVWGLVRQGNPRGNVGGQCANPWGLGNTMTERRRRGRLAGTARGPEGWHRGDGHGDGEPARLT